MYICVYLCSMVATRYMCPVFASEGPLKSHSRSQLREGLTKVSGGWATSIVAHVLGTHRLM